MRRRSEKGKSGGADRVALIEGRYDQKQKTTDNMQQLRIEWHLQQNIGKENRSAGLNG
jgi:hypothetical protein